MVNLVTIDAQHQGVFGFPGCLPENNEFCEVLRDLLEIAYTPLLQENLVQVSPQVFGRMNSDIVLTKNQSDNFFKAQYWHDPTQGDLHRRVSKFIGSVII